MKKLLFALLAGFIPGLIATNGAYAQNSVNPEILEPQNNVTEITNSVDSDKNRTVDLSAISPKAIKNFAASYKNAKDEKWDKTSEGFTAKFKFNGVSNLIFFNQNGKWAGSLKGYFEDKLPFEVRDRVKREYYDYSITYVQEVETIESNRIPTYIIHMEDKKSIKQIRISEGQMDVYKQYNKQWYLPVVPDRQAITAKMEYNNDTQGTVLNITNILLTRAVYKFIFNSATKSLLV